MSKLPRVHTLEPIVRQSTSQPQLQTSDKDGGWYSRTPISERLPEYDATKDPYCPYTHTKTFKKHLEKQKKHNPNEHLMSKTTSYQGIEASMKNMDRPSSAPEREQFPKHQVQNETFLDSGVTFSSEPRGNAAEGQAELEVLKAILSREGYMTRLFKLIRKVEKKFKPEIADIIDLIRVATFDVVEAIQKWRSIKVIYLTYFLQYK
jgi:hypothetical protein